MRKARGGRPSHGAPTATPQTRSVRLDPGNPWGRCGRHR
jgi:hypothetical protein